MHTYRYMYVNNFKIEDHFDSGYMDSGQWIQTNVIIKVKQVINESLSKLWQLHPLSEGQENKVGIKII